MAPTRTRTGVSWSTQAEAWRAKAKKHGFLFREHFGNYDEALQVQLDMREFLANMHPLDVQKLHDSCPDDLPLYSSADPRSLPNHVTE